MTPEQIDTGNAYMLFYERRGLDYEKYAPAPEPTAVDNAVRSLSPILELSTPQALSDRSASSTVPTSAFTYSDSAAGRRPLSADARRSSIADGDLLSSGVSALASSSDYAVRNGRVGSSTSSMLGSAMRATQQLPGTLPGERRSSPSNCSIH